MKFIFFLPLIFFFFIAASVEEKKTCPNCNEKEIPYPLSTADDCGDPNYHLLCDQTGLKFLSANKSSYPVQTIEAKNNSLIITPPEITNDCRTSDLKYNGLLIEEESPFSISDKNTVMLFNCSKNILRSPLNCSENSICHRYAEEKAEGCKKGICCSFLKDSSATNHQIRIREDGCTAYTSVVYLDESEKVESWKVGVQLEWVEPPSHAAAAATIVADGD